MQKKDPISLDPRLASDSTFVADLELCQIRLSHNAAFPWILLIPQRKEVSEIIDLNANDQKILMQEIALASEVMQSIFHPTKLNIASLGNIVSQLHIHIIARYHMDPAWPHPVWNSGVESVYDLKEKEECITRLKATFLEFMPLKKNLQH
jgi:diadenosine tetraphosphate (Ap4A) HIT family hydrolase